MLLTFLFIPDAYADLALKLYQYMQKYNPLTRFTTQFTQLCTVHYHQTQKFRHLVNDYQENGNRKQATVTFTTCAWLATFSMKLP